MPPPAMSRREAEARIRELREAYAAEIRKVYSDAERRMLGIVARRLEQGIDLTDGQHWAAKKLAEITALQKQINNEIKDLRKLDPKIEEAIQAAYDAGSDAAAADLIRANLTDLYADTSLARGSAVRTLSASTVHALEGTHLRILRVAVDAYRSTVAESTSQVLIGTATRRQAAQLVLNRFADSGISGFVDGGGRAWDLASYAEMAVRTATGQASNQGRLEKYQAGGRDLVMVSAGSESCDLCEPWEGQILSISGQTEGYATVADAEADGLWHPNCTHSVEVYIPGLTRDMEKVPKDQNDEAYKERQKQRYIERGIRQWKNREAVAITDDARAQTAGKVKEWQGKMREFIDTTGRRRDYGRESITRAR